MSARDVARQNYQRHGDGAFTLVLGRILECEAIGHVDEIRYWKNVLKHLNRIDKWKQKRRS